MGLGSTGAAGPGRVSAVCGCARRGCARSTHIEVVDAGLRHRGAYARGGRAHGRRDARKAHDGRQGRRESGEAAHSKVRKGRQVVRNRDALAPRSSTPPPASVSAPPLLPPRIQVEDCVWIATTRASPLTPAPTRRVHREEDEQRKTKSSSWMRLTRRLFVMACETPVVHSSASPAPVRARALSAATAAARGRGVAAVVFDMDGTITHPNAIDFVAMRRRIGAPDGHGTVPMTRRRAPATPSAGRQ